MIKIQNFIGGRLLEPAGGRYLDNWEPAAGRAYSRVPDSGPEDIKKAVAAAQKAFPAWSKRPAVQRAKILRTLASFRFGGTTDFTDYTDIDGGGSNGRVSP